MKTHVVLSFDVGINNLAFCLKEVCQADTGDVTVAIKDWGILDISTDSKKNDIGLISENMIDTMHDKFYDIDLDFVLIENQPVQKNPTMKSIQIMLFTFFKMKSFQVSPITVRLVSASNKLKVKHKTDDSYPEKSKYNQNKMLSIAYASHYLQNIYKESDWFRIMKTHKKKDDLCDSYLQGVHFIENNLKLFV